MAFVNTFTLAGRRTSPTLRNNVRLLNRTAPSMSLKKGDKMPMDGELMVLQDGKPTPISVESIFAGKKVAMVTVPGALTSTCQNAHVPQWIRAVDDFKAKGVDEVVCLAVNDPFVMDVFEKAVGGGGKVKFVGDGGAKLVKELGIDIDTGGFGGVRAYRGGYLVEDGVFTQVNLEEGTSFDGPSKPDTLLAQM